MISIIIPILDEPAIADFILRVHEVMSDVPGKYEVLVVMGDRESLFPEIPPVPNQRVVKSFGDSLERGILTGFSHARGDRMVVIDGDGSHPVSLIPTFHKYLEEYEMVLGVREGERLNVNKIRGVITSFFFALAKWRGSKLSDPMSGFFGFRSEIIDKIKFAPLTWKICLEIELKAKPSIHEIPFTFGLREAGESKTSFRVGLRLIKDLLLFN
jgi:dolichol-phosphate mannosyltransferase